MSASSGAEGLKLVLQQPVDLIVLDVQMPEMDGFEVAKILRSHNRTRDIPIVFASAEKKERQSVMKGFEEGAVDYLPKPLDPELTRAKISVLLKLQQQKKELVEMNESLKSAQADIARLNGELEKKVNQLQSVNRELESFSYSVSHDLRAPLRSIIGYSQVLNEDYGSKLDDDARRVIATVQSNASRMNVLIDDLLEFSKLGKKELMKSTVDMEALVRSVLNDISSTQNHSAEIKIFDLEKVEADMSLLTQVWVNLLSNAIKYSAKKPNPVVEIGSRKEGDEIIYWVRDNGAGFDMKYADRLFGVFQRLHKREQFEGTGIGLALCLRIVTKHGGRIWAESQVDEGATFWFSLPG